jgi:hypothetical protein
MEPVMMSYVRHFATQLTNLLRQFESDGYAMTDGKVHDMLLACENMAGTLHAFEYYRRGVKKEAQHAEQ